MILKKKSGTKIFLRGVTFLAAAGIWAYLAVLGMTEKYPYILPLQTGGASPLATLAICWPGVLIYFVLGGDEGARRIMALFVTGVLFLSARLNVNNYLICQDRAMYIDIKRFSLSFIDVKNAIGAAEKGEKNLYLKQYYVLLVLDEDSKDSKEEAEKIARDMPVTIFWADLGRDRYLTPEYCDSLLKNVGTTPAYLVKENNDFIVFSGEDMHSRLLRFLADRRREGIYFVDFDSENPYIERLA